MPRVRINLRDLVELDDLEDLEDLEDLTDQGQRNRLRGRIESRHPLSEEVRHRKLDERRKGREFTRIQRRRIQE